ncbi:hypothetical protein L1887_53907 [Cichorium endivia]|nr:hypothetical protein L1887_53907 [Cichorium endivia]
MRFLTDSSVQTVKMSEPNEKVDRQPKSSNRRSLLKASLFVLSFLSSYLIYQYLSLSEVDRLLLFNFANFERNVKWRSYIEKFRNQSRDKKFKNLDLLINVHDWPQIHSNYKRALFPVFSFSKDADLYKDLTYPAWSYPAIAERIAENGFQFVSRLSDRRQCAVLLDRAVDQIPDDDRLQSEARKGLYFGLNEFLIDFYSSRMLFNC